jgi:hypothetical protein
MFSKAVFIFVAAFLFVNAHADQPGFQIKSKTSKVMKFTGTVIDNKSLGEHKDSLVAFLPKLNRNIVHDNVQSGYSIYMTDGKIYKLAFSSVSGIYNDIRSPRGDCTMHSLKISGNARILAGDTLQIIDFIEVK